MCAQSPCPCPHKCTHWPSGQVLFWRNRWNKGMILFGPIWLLVHLILGKGPPPVIPPLPKLCRTLAKLTKKQNVPLPSLCCCYWLLVLLLVLSFLPLTTPLPLPTDRNITYITHDASLPSPPTHFHFFLSLSFRLFPSPSVSCSTPLGYLFLIPKFSTLVVTRRYCNIDCSPTCVPLSLPS